MGKYFGTDGVRGVANEGLSLDIAYRIGRYLGNYAKTLKGKIVIGKDTRLSSSMFENMLASSIASSGSDAYLLGYCSTPCLAYVAENDDFDLGVMISASHNPYYDNGIKIFANDGSKFSEDILLKIEEYIDNPVGIDYLTHENIGNINLYPEGIDHYKDWLKKIYPNDLSKYKLLIDCANGSNYLIASEVLKDLNCNVTIINNEPNGININNQCGSTHLDMLQAEIKKDNYDLGLAFDGDADRLQVVDNDGNIINGDHIMFVLAKYLKDINKLENDTLVVTGYSNIGLHKALEKLNIKRDIVDNGDKYVLESMLKNNYSLGGEQSGHIIIKKDSNFGDGLKTALCLLEALSYYDLDINKATSELTIYPQLLVNQKVKDKNVVLNDEDINTTIEIIRNDLNGDGQILVRASGTEPLIRVMVEAENDELCHKYVYQVIDLINEKGYAI